MPPANHHKLDFIEIPATDLMAAKKFYGRAFGWTFQDWGDDYADIQGAGVAGGLRKVDAAPARGGTLAIVYSGDLAASEQAVEKAGGQITERHEFPGGRRFHFVDPSGVELAVWTKAEAEGGGDGDGEAAAEPEPEAKPAAKPKAKPAAKAKAKAKAKPAAKAKPKTTAKTTAKAKPARR